MPTAGTTCTVIVAPAGSGVPPCVYVTTALVAKLAGYVTRHATNAFGSGTASFGTTTVFAASGPGIEIDTEPSVGIFVNCTPTYIVCGPTEPTEIGVSIAIVGGVTVLPWIATHASCDCEPTSAVMSCELR